MKPERSPSRGLETEYWRARCVRPDESVPGGMTPIDWPSRTGNGVLPILHSRPLACKVDLYLDQQQIDTTTPSGRLLFQVTGAFGEFERSMIRERVNAGLARAKAAGKTLGRPRNDDAKQRAAVVRLRKQGVGILKIARTVGAGTS